MCLSRLIGFLCFSNFLKICFSNTQCPRSLDADLGSLVKAAEEFDWERISFVLEARVYGQWGVIILSYLICWISVGGKILASVTGLSPLSASMVLEIIEQVLNKLHGWIGSIFPNLLIHFLNDEVSNLFMFHCHDAPRSCAESAWSNSLLLPKMSRRTPRARAFKQHTAAGWSNSRRTRCFSNRNGSWNMAQLGWSGMQSKLTWTIYFQDEPVFGQKRSTDNQFNFHVNFYHINFHLDQKTSMSKSQTIWVLHLDFSISQIMLLRYSVLLHPGPEFQNHWWWSWFFFFRRSSKGARRKAQREGPNWSHNWRPGGLWGLHGWG